MLACPSYFILVNQNYKPTAALAEVKHQYKRSLLGLLDQDPLKSSKAPMTNFAVAGLDGQS